MKFEYGTLETPKGRIYFSQIGNMEKTFSKEELFKKHLKKMGEILKITIENYKI